MERVIVCRCEDIAHDEIEAAIDEGYVTLDELKRKLRCGMGACQGRTCMRLIARIVSQRTGRPMASIKLPTARPPVRAIPLGVLLAVKDDMNDE